MPNRAATVIALSLALSLGLGACHKKGPAEKLGENIDEAARTIKNGGEKTPGDKLKDAGEDAADAVRDATK